MLSLPVYLDYNATTPVDPRVLEAMIPFFTQRFGNAASLHHAPGRSADAAVKNARTQVADLVGAAPAEIIFTSGATESVNLALKGVLEMYQGKGRHIITASTEHSAVLDSCAHLERLGATVTRLGVDDKGRINLTELEQAIRPETVLIALMYANNETGVISPVARIKAIARERNILFFCDATQSVGKIPVNVQTDGPDLMAFSAHKMYGPKGVGALYLRRRDPRARLNAQMDGGGHERGLRSGTLNVPGIVGFGAAAALCVLESGRDAVHTAALRDGLEAALLRLPGTFVNGDRQNRLPQVTNIGFEGVNAEQVMLSLQTELAMATGSACTSASPEPSHVLMAMGQEEVRASAALRIGFGRFSTTEEMAFAVRRIFQVVETLRAERADMFLPERH